MEARSSKAMRALVVLLALLVFGLCLSLAYGYHAWTELKAAVGTQKVTTLHETGNVVAAVRELSNLETVSFHMERVIDLREQTSQLFGLVQAEDAILLVAAADVVAGIDLSTLREGDVQVDAERNSVSVVLPPPSILSARLDNERTYVHTRSTDALAQRSNELETKARQAAERLLRDAAVKAGVLSRAGQSGRRAIEGLLKSLGFARVEVQFRPE